MKEIVEDRIRSDRFGHFLLTNRQIQSHTTTQTAKAKAIILLSLYGSNYYKDDKKIRVSNIRRLLDENREPYKRACRLFQLGGDATKDSLGISDDLEEFVINYGTGGDSPGYNVFKFHQIPMCRRVQKSGSCFLHASIVLAAYKAYMCTPGKGVGNLPIVDMSKYVRHGFGSKNLTQFLIENSGGDSKHHLRKLTGGGGQTTLEIKPQLFKTDSEGASQGVCQLITLLQEYGPALVSQFIVDPHLIEVATSLEETLQEPPFLGGLNSSASNEVADRHAMVLVGVRFVQNEWRVLLQNWWPNMPFVEVSEEYLRSSDALLTFVISNDVQIPSRFDRCDAVYAEADLEGIDFDDE